MNFRAVISAVLALATLAWGGFIGYEYFQNHAELARAAAGGSGALIQKFLDGGPLALFGSAGFWGIFLGKILAVPLAILAALLLFWTIQKIRGVPARLDFSLRPTSFLGMFLLAVWAIVLWSAGRADIPADIFGTAGALIERLFPPVVTVALVALASWTLGRVALSRLRLDLRPGFETWLFPQAAGLFLLQLLVFVLGVAGFLGQISAWALLILVPAIFWKQTFEFWRILRTPVKISAPVFSAGTLAGLFVALLLVMNFADLVRPMPIGWDDMGVYLNHARLAAIRGDFLHLGQQAWILMMTLGFSMWGTAAAGPGVMAAMFLAWAGGAAGIFAMIALARRYFSGTAGLVAAAVFLGMPMLAWLTMLDMKVDPTQFFILTMGTWATLRWFFPADPAARNARWLAVAAALFGFAWTIKITTVFPYLGLVAAVGGWLVWQMFARVASFRHVLIPLGLTVIFAIFAGAAFFFGQKILGAGLGFVAFVAFLFPFWRTDFFKKTVVPAVLAAVIGTLVAVGPWAGKAAIEVAAAGRLGEISAMKTLVNGEDSRAPQPDFAAVGIDRDRDCPAGTAFEEEIGRYFGRDKGDGIVAYLRLPWKITMNTASGGFYLTISFIFLVIVPVAAALWAGSRATDGKKFDPVLAAILGISAISWLGWAVKAEGIPWYNLYGFLGLALLVGVSFDAARRAGILVKIALATVLIVATGANFVTRMERSGGGNLLLFSTGKITSEQFFDRILPGYREIAATVNSVDAPLYRVGTFIQYFVDENDRRVFQDSQLDAWNCLNFDRDGGATLGRMQKLGYRFIVFDLNTHTIEKNPEGTLHQKVARFAEWVSKYATIRYQDATRGIALIELVPPGTAPTPAPVRAQNAPANFSTEGA